MKTSAWVYIFCGPIGLLVALLLGGCVEQMTATQEQEGTGAPDPLPLACGSTVDGNMDGDPDYTVRLFRNQLGQVTREEYDFEADGTVDEIRWFEYRDDGRLNRTLLDGGQAPPDGTWDWEEQHMYGEECGG